MTEIRILISGVLLLRVSSFRLRRAVECGLPKPMFYLNYILGVKLNVRRRVV